MQQDGATEIALLEESLPLTEVDFYDAIKKEFGTDCNEEFCIRLARAYRGEKKNRMGKTIGETRKVLEWRKQVKADELLETKLEQADVFAQSWPSMISGEDYYGHIINYDRLKDIQLDACLSHFNLEQVLLHRAKHMERLRAEMAAVSKRAGRRIYRHICIFDLSGIGLKHMAPSVINFLKPIFDLGQVYYPESLFRMYLVNAPFVFWGTWKIISNFIDPETKEKIQIFKNADSFVADAKKHGIPMSAIPKALGGESVGRMLDDNFVVSSCVPASE
ncbi:hypothetical protein SPRG_19985 [Saprolegnia parasitica CBS 223.65]|uniref:CRAL-TRIO domain-containing protein n=1 Tax=Saprolegnia parasitica (strain CBS 223.65) TaxID=695850 RepID=A0A067CQH7_SAPPC|nr:hypothetical protein SPRG_19985 [Saprolegnia parasitica CBS 223.65]KDO28771.1 hypothetical protein SPRG_19985 [Saprolegnia parasitica CBS 223.65]|eukprot:XP_012200516.1 hypothetical protein SPRG_19985 [Saprolegnia parasitica CBS 223.65]